MTFSGGNKRMTEVAAGIVNLVSYNYMTYYNQYEEMEFGQFLHQGTLMDEAWKRSALKYVSAAHTPTLIIHGENDNDVPIAEAEQFFIGLKDVGTEAVFVRSKRSSTRSTGPTVRSLGTKSISRSPAPKASPTSSRERHYLM